MVYSMIYSIVYRKVTDLKLYGKCLECTSFGSWRHFNFNPFLRTLFENPTPNKSPAQMISTKKRTGSFASTFGNSRRRLTASTLMAYKVTKQLRGALEPHMKFAMNQSWGIVAGFMVDIVAEYCGVNTSADLTLPGTVVCSVCSNVVVGSHAWKDIYFPSTMYSTPGTISCSTCTKLFRSMGTSVDVVHAVLHSDTGMYLSSVIKTDPTTDNPNVDASIVPSLAAGPYHYWAVEAIIMAYCNDEIADVTSTVNLCDARCVDINVFTQVTNYVIPLEHELYCDEFLSDTDDPCYYTEEGFSDDSTLEIVDALDLEELPGRFQSEDQYSITLP